MPDVILQVVKEKPLYTKKQVAELLNIKERTLNEYIKGGEIEVCFLPSWRVRIAQKEYQRFVDRCYRRRRETEKTKANGVDVLNNILAERRQAALSARRKRV